ncbi:MAG: hypothetical protein K2J06_07425, partial [Muribaculaceae bacterium]|nr:hypothetical protein [Muribaculaceae bacterium]
MEKLNFVVTWGEDKTRAWSGTYYSIHQALEKYYDIADFDTIEPNRFANVYAKILLKLGLRKDDFNVRYILKNRKHYENRLSGKIFQFTEFIQDSPSRQTYIYQDLSVPYLYYLARTNSRGLIYSVFVSVDSKAMKRLCN